MAQLLSIPITADLGIGVNGLVTAGTIDDTSGTPINGAGTLIAGGTLGGLVLADVAGQTLTVEVAAFNGGVEASGATLLLSLSGGASALLNVVDGDFTRGVMDALNGGTLVLPATISEISGSTLSTPQVTLEGAGASILAGGEPIQNSLTDLGFGAQLAVNGYDFADPNTLTVGGFVWDASGQFGLPQAAGTLAPTVYQELASGEIDASATMVLAPGTFVNLVAGTLSIGSYGSSGTLELPGRRERDRECNG